MTRLAELREALAIFVWSEAQATAVGTVYRGPAEFVLTHGESFEPRALPEEFDYGAPQACYGNAIILAATRGLTYVEGYALGPGGLPISHAWNVDDRGRLVDSTWSALEDSGKRHAMPNSAYLGVRFSVGRADDATWNGDACVLDDWHRCWQLLREPWTGEDWEREWKPTSALRTIRAYLGT